MGVIRPNAWLAILMSACAGYLWHGPNGACYGFIASGALVVLATILVGRS